MPCAYPSACNSLSHLLHLTVLPPTQHSACGSSFWSKISPLGSHSNLCIYLYYHLSRFVVHVKSHTLDCELFRCRNCVLIPLGPPYSPFYPWCRHLLNPRWIQPFRAPDLYCLHPPTGRSKRFRLKRMSSCPRGWPGSGPHFLPWPQPAGPGNPGLGPLQHCLSLSRTPTWLPAAQQGPAGLGRRGKAYQADFLPSCSFGGA